jgi:hypothetical protein
LRQDFLEFSLGFVEATLLHQDLDLRKARIVFCGWALCCFSCRRLLPGESRRGAAHQQQNKAHRSSE